MWVLKANDFVILKRKQRMLSRAEVAFLAQEEKVSAKNLAMYSSIMTESKSEIVVMTKIAAVTDAYSIANGCGSYGRRRVS